MNYQRKMGGLGVLTGDSNSGEWVLLHPSRIQWTDLYTEQVRAGVRMMIYKINETVNKIKN